MARQRIARVDELRPGDLRRFEVSGVAVCVARTDDGSFRAIGDTCTHEGASLADGTLIGNTVECADHGSLFDLITGSALSLPAQIPEPVYPVSIENGEIVIDL